MFYPMQLTVTLDSPDSPPDPHIPSTPLPPPDEEDEDDEDPEEDEEEDEEEGTMQPFRPRATLRFIFLQQMAHIMTMTLLSKIVGLLC